MTCASLSCLVFPFSDIFYTLSFHSVVLTEYPVHITLVVNAGCLLPSTAGMHVFALIPDHYLWERFGLEFTNLACVGFQIIGRVKADPDFLPRLSVSTLLCSGIANTARKNVHKNNSLVR